MVFYNVLRHNVKTRWFVLLCNKKCSKSIVFWPQPCTKWQKQWNNTLFGSDSIPSVKCSSTFNIRSKDCNKKENITATYNVTTVAPKGDEKEQNRTQRNSSMDNTEQTESVNSTGLIIGICVPPVVLITAIAVVLVLKRWNVAGCCSSRDDILDLTEQGPLN